MEAKLLRESNPNPRTRSNRLDLGLGFDSLRNFAAIWSLTLEKYVSAPHNDFCYYLDFQMV